ncbi:hypothetical protein FHR83_002987 [Actinoplanes campanulatus]|uniref:Uncharacterized protein n=1 Tax=Actinoplanes campanulatus TaxID=113559 RepID=A0A7W5AGF6_9ACTN|nr:hypothetical protein [Actinoplanes campanulatus]MBB3095324.1 hypothetical protein [Actinoplanes campanulatus]GGN41532.1 hypothetical protein GCM10010109_71700 [Actinoplanes campanulatus]GID34928.1 hypothetical protein Aca09nite_14340 [Actinoplanes campanulatus]
MKRTIAIIAACAVVLASAGVAAAAAVPSPLTLVAAGRTVTAERYVDGDDVYLSFNLGLHVIAGKDPLVVRASRTGRCRPGASPCPRRTGSGT